jgi:hypothetical protein
MCSRERSKPCARQAAVKAAQQLAPAVACERIVTACTTQFSYSLGPRPAISDGPRDGTEPWHDRHDIGSSWGLL